MTVIVLLVCFIVQQVHVVIVLKVFLLALFLMSLNVNYLICTECFFSYSAMLHLGFEML